MIYAVDYSPDGRHVAAACQDGSVYLLDTTTGAVRGLRGGTACLFPHSSAAVHGMQLVHTPNQYRHVSCRWRRWRYVSAPSSRYMAPLAVWKVTVMFYEATGT